MPTNTKNKPNNTDRLRNTMEPIFIEPFWSQNFSVRLGEQFLLTVSRSSSHVINIRVRKNADGKQKIVFNRLHTRMHEACASLY